MLALVIALGRLHDTLCSASDSYHIVNYDAYQLPTSWIRRTMGPIPARSIAALDVPPLLRVGGRQHGPSTALKRPKIIALRTKYEVAAD